MPKFDPQCFAQLDQLLIPHSGFKSAAAAIRQTVRGADAFTDKSFLPILGPSRSGKSRLLFVTFLQLQAEITSEPETVPISYVALPRSTRMKTVLVTMQEALGDPFCDSGSEDQSFRRMVKLYQRMKLKYLFLDELQRCVSDNGKVNYELAELFKVLVDAGITIIGAGLESSTVVLEANEQLTGRCMQAINLPRFDWNNPKFRAEFIAIVQAFCRGLPGIDFPPCEDESTGFRWFVACGGLIGYLHKMMRQLLLNLRDGNKSVVTFSDLSDAHRTAIYYSNGQLRPFDNKFDVTDKVPGLIHAASIGEKRHPEGPKSTRPSPGGMPR